MTSDYYDRSDVSEAGARRLLIVEDDDAFRERLGQAMTRRGFAVETAATVEAALSVVDAAPPDYAVVDLRIGDGDGLDVISALHDVRPDAKAIILTGYGNIPTAVAAVKVGAVDYIAKPISADEVEAALLSAQSLVPSLPDVITKPNEARLEHIVQVFEAHDRNVSETARQLGMHRRTLQRLLPRALSALDRPQVAW